MFGDLRAAIDTGDWPDALSLALEHWRNTRSVVLANLVDALSARCPSPAAGGARGHTWWVSEALTYDPQGVRVLLRYPAMLKLDAELSERALEQRHTGEPARTMLIEALASITTGFHLHGLALVDRVLAVACWPDDPRTPPMLVGWLLELESPWVNGGLLPPAFIGTIGRLLARIGDRRCLAALHKAAVEPPGLEPWIRQRQQICARDVIALFPSTECPADVEAAAAVLLEALAPVVSPVDEDALWRDVAADPDDDGPRLVLADALVERGDPRGEVIVLQCGAAPSPKNRGRVDRLIKEHWRDWLGDATLVLPRRLAGFQRGMLVAASVGMHSTPDWAWAKLAGHRELGVVDTIREHHAPAERFAQVLDAIEHDVRRVSIASEATISALARVRPQWPARVLEYRRTHPSIGGPITIHAVIEALAELFPELEELRFERGLYSWDPEDLRAALAQAPAQCPELTRIVIDRSVYGSARAEGLPLVEVVG